MFYDVKVSNWVGVIGDMSFYVQDSDLELHFPEWISTFYAYNSSQGYLRDLEFVNYTSKYWPVLVKCSGNIFCYV